MLHWEIPPYTYTWQHIRKYRFCSLTCNEVFQLIQPYLLRAYFRSWTLLSHLRWFLKLFDSFSNKHTFGKPTIYYMEVFHVHTMDLRVHWWSFGKWRFRNEMSMFKEQGLMLFGIVQTKPGPLKLRDDIRFLILRMLLSWLELKFLLLFIPALNVTVVIRMKSKEKIAF